MAKEKKKALVPKLRFPEFQNAGGWTTEKLGAVAAISTEKVGLNICVPMSITSGVGLVSQADKFGRVIAGDSYKNYLLLKPNDFAYNKSATKDYPEGFLTLYSGTELAAVPNSIFTCFRINGPSPDARFLNYQFSDNLHGRWLRRFIQVGARAHGSLSISDSDLMALPVPVPVGAKSVAEQQKIADCLSSLDKLIAAQGRKVEALKTYKRGLMQQLFPREGETLPRLRFPEFRDAPEWEEQTLRSICIRIMDGTHFSPKSKEGPRPYLTSKNIRNGHIDLSTISYISEDEHREIYTRCPVKKDDILLTKDGANTGNCAINTLDFEFSLLSSVAVLRGDAALVKQNFLYQTITSERTQSNIINSMSGQAITRITLEKLGNFVVSLPNLAEQQRIAQFLSFFDTQIMAEADKFAALNLQKKGLLQQLFPSMGEA